MRERYFTSKLLLILSYMVITSKIYNNSFDIESNATLSVTNHTFKRSPNIATTINDLYFKTIHLKRFVSLKGVLYSFQL